MDNHLHHEMVASLGSLKWSNTTLKAEKQVKVLVTDIAAGKVLE